MGESGEFCRPPPPPPRPGEMSLLYWSSLAWYNEDCWGNKMGRKSIGAGKCGVGVSGRAVEFNLVPAELEGARGHGLGW